MTIKETVEKVRGFIRLKHFSLSTEGSYCYYVDQFCRHSLKLPRSMPTEKRIESYLSTFAEKDSSASSQNVAFNAVLFLYRNILGVEPKNVDALRATRPAIVRNAPTMADTRSLLKFVAERESSEISLACDMIYGTGARVTEPLNVRVRDVQSDFTQLIYRQAKHHKDRVVQIPCSLAERIKQQLDYARNVWEREGSRWPVKLPGRLRFKYPHAEFSWQWFWLFPAKHPCEDKREDGRLVRWRLHETNIQRAVRRAAIALGLSVLPHELRHGFATHALNIGNNPRAIQLAMGHKSLETTMAYCHADVLSVRSPIDHV